MSLLLFAILIVTAVSGQGYRVFDDLHSVGLNCLHSHIRFVDLNVTTLPLGAFRLCTTTKVLDLSNNQLEEIIPGAFHGLYSLSELYLSSNKIKEILSGTFIPLTNLEVLVLSENLLYTLPEAELRSKTLRYLNFYNNRLTNMPNYILQQLKLIDLLDVSNNNLSQLDENALINVQGGGTINLSNNCLTSIAFKITVSYARSTTTFLASGNWIQNITKKSFGTLHHLNIVDLDLSFNYIDFIENGAFDSHVHLKHLHLSHNKLVELPPKIFQYLLKLTSIDLSHNRFTNTIFDLHYAKSIKYLNYSYNLITDMSDYFWVPESSDIQELNVMRNKIMFLDGNLVSQQIKSISLLYNDWKCGVLYNLWNNLERRGIKALGLMDVNEKPCEPQIKFQASVLKITRKNFIKTRKVKQQQLARNVTGKEEDTFHFFERKMNVLIHMFVLINLFLILPFFL